jgi:myo-inositol-1(or 4)-monophosphatase
MQPDIQQLTSLITETARTHLKPRFQRVAGERKSDGSFLTEADLAMHHALMGILAQRWPEIRLLSEEMSPEEQTECLTSGRPLWCIDPLDGTSNFAAGIPLYSVSLALVVEGKPVLGVIYDPERDECFTAVRGRGAWLNGKVLKSRPGTDELSSAVGIVDFKRLPKPIAEQLVRHPPYHSQRNLGSCALEWAWLAAGRGDFYLHGGMRMWDLAAGSLILGETGGRSVTLEGDGVFQSETGPRSVIAARNAVLFQALLKTFSVPVRS